MYQKVKQGEESLANYKLEDVIASTSTNALSARTACQNEKRKDSFEGQGTQGAIMLVNLPNNKKSDGRTCNSGAPIRQSYTIDFKVGFIERVQLALDDPDLPTITKPTSYFRSIGCNDHDVENIGAKKDESSRI